MECAGHRGFIFNKGYVWCVICKRRLGTIEAYCAPPPMQLPEAPKTLVWVETERKRHSALVNLETAKQFKLERVCR